MEKLLKRTAQAERQAARRLARRSKIAERADLRSNFARRMQAYAAVNKSRRDARKMQREDWQLGPLAPQRDTPIKNPQGAYFGSASEEVAMHRFGDKQIDLACKWAGGTKFLCLKVGDRVAITEGPNKGKIAPIKTIEMDKGVVTLDDDLMQRNVTLNEVIYKMQPQAGFVQLTPLHVPIQAIRLVHPLTEPQTNRTRDVLIQELVPTGITRDKPTGRMSWTRVVPGLNIEIPWPRAFEEEEQNELDGQYEDHACDTLRIDAEHPSWTPTLLTPPMPPQVLNELRNRYSKFRTRHEPEYIKKKEDQEYAKAVAKGKIPAPSMMTPLEELNAKIRAERKDRQEPELTDSMLLKIGRIMAREDGRRFSGKHMRNIETKMTAEGNAARATEAQV